MHYYLMQWENILSFMIPTSLKKMCFIWTIWGVYACVISYIIYLNSIGGELHFFPMVLLQWFWFSDYFCDVRTNRYHSIPNRFNGFSYLGSIPLCPLKEASRV